MTSEAPGNAIRYEIRLSELLTAADSGRFAGCSIRRMPDGSTAVTTPPLDQSALYGLLRKTRDSGLTLASINPSRGTFRARKELKMKNEWLGRRILGFAFLLQGLTSLASGLFLAPLFGADGDAGGMLARLAAHPLSARAAILCDMGTAIGVIFLGAALYAALRRQGEVFALTGFGLYILEGALIAAGRIDAFSLLRMGQEYAAAGSPPLFGALASIGSEAARYGSVTLSMAAFSVGAILLYYLLFKSRIVPRPIGAWGLFSVFFCLVGTAMGILGYPPPLVFYALYIPFEFFIAIWIIVKGVKEAAA